MRTSTDAQGRESPEQRVGRLAAQLRNHELWDSLLICSPPLLVGIYLGMYLYRAAWIAPITFLLLSGAVIGLSLLAVVVHTRRLRPSVRSAARLVDEKTEAKDRFLTLATIDVALWPAALVGRLRSEAAALLERIDFRHEFPYRIKRSFYWSFLISLIAATLFHLSMPLMGSTRRQAPAYEKLSELAEKMAQRPPLSTLAYDLRTLAMKLQDPNVAEQEKQTLIHKALEQVEKQQKKEKEQESRALLGEASSTLQGLEQQSARSQQKDAEKGDGGAQSNPSQEGQGEGKQSQGGGDSKGELNAERSKDMQQGQDAQEIRRNKAKNKTRRARVIARTINRTPATNPTKAPVKSSPGRPQAAPRKNPAGAGPTKSPRARLRRSGFTNPESKVKRESKGPVM